MTAKSLIERVASGVDPLTALTEARAPSITKQKIGSAEAGEAKLKLELPTPTSQNLMVRVNQLVGARSVAVNRNIVIFDFEPNASLDRKERLLKQSLYRQGIARWPEPELKKLFPGNSREDNDELFGVDK